MPSSSKPSVRPSAVAAVACPASTPSTCPRTCCARSSSGPGSTRRSSTTSIWGCVSQVGEQTFNVGRSAVLAAGWPESVPGVTVDRQCGSSQQSVHFAAAGLVSGQYDVVVAGGVESMSRVTLGSSATGGMPFGQTVLDRYADALAAAGTPFFNQGVGAELIATRWGQTREDLDAFALESHERAAAATDSGAFDGPDRAR